MLVAVMLAGACSPPQPVTTSQDCPGHTGGSTSGVMVLIDRTASSDTPALHEERLSEVMLAIDQAIDSEATFTVAYFDGSGTTIDVDPCLSNRVMGVSGNNSRTRSDSQIALRRGVRQIIGQGMESGAVVEGSDPLAAFRFGARQMDSGSERFAVVVDRLHRDNGVPQHRASRCG